MVIGDTSNSLGATFTPWGRVLFVLLIVGLGLFALIDERRRI
jgi:hypothetical protein